jgi:glycerol transport system ATP-binding protein
MTLELQGVSRLVEGRVHIHPTDLTLQGGTMNVLLGPTLSGKTSLMRLMAGLDKPSAGRVLWNGQDVTGQRVQDRQVAMVYQQFINYPAMSVYDNIASPLRIAGANKAEIDRRVNAVAEMLKLTPMLTRKPLELSGGQQQRCALARALVKGAELVLLDEPLANLDYKLREELRVEIPKIFEASGAIFVYATTEPEEALLLGGNTATLHEGRITQFGPTPQVYRQPQDVLTARVFSDPPMNFLPCQLSDGEINFGPVRMKAPETVANGLYMAGFRANHLSLHGPGLPFACKVKVTEITGSESFLHLDHDGNAWVGLVHGVQDMATGTDVTVHVDPNFMYLFDVYGRLAYLAPYARAA